MWVLEERKREASSFSFARFLWLWEVTFHPLRCCIVSVDYPNRPLLVSPLAQSSWGNCRLQAFSDLAKCNWVRSSAGWRPLQVSDNSGFGDLGVFCLSHWGKAHCWGCETQQSLGQVTWLPAVSISPSGKCDDCLPLKRKTIHLKLQQPKEVQGITLKNKKSQMR